MSQYRSRSRLLDLVVVKSETSENGCLNTALAVDYLITIILPKCQIVVGVSIPLSQ